MEKFLCMVISDHYFRDRVKLRHGNNFVYLKPSAQSGNATLSIPNLGCNNQIVALSYVKKKVRQVLYSDPIEKFILRVMFIF